MTAALREIPRLTDVRGEINVADDQKTATARLIDEADPQTTLNATLAWVDRLP